MKIDLGLQTDSALAYIKLEGLQAYKNRKRDYADEVKRLKKVKEMEPDDKGRVGVGFDPAAVLNVSPFPPAPNRSGAVATLIERLKEEQKRRPVALAYPRDGSWWLESWFDDEAGIYSLGSKTSLVDLIAQAARLAGTDFVHIESLLGLPVNLPSELEKAGISVIVTITDFALFCRRPHLIDTITGRFCEYCRDVKKCSVCLKDMDPEGRYPQNDYRRISAASVRSASALVFPSAFIQRQHEEFFPDRREDQKVAVIAPATKRPEVFTDRSVLRPNIAFIGGIVPHKGGRLIPPVMERVRSREKKAVGYIYGSGDGELIDQIKRAKGVKIRGYYSHGTLPELLVQDKISVAVMPSITPEAYSMVIDETLSTGTPVVAFDHGAVADRLEFWSVGELIPPERGANGLAEAVLDSLSGRKIGTDVIRTLPSLDRVAQKYIDLYSSIKNRRRRSGE
jgi:glycosyltransferase involved in cell wall biosynthesis